MKRIIPEYSYSKEQLNIVKNLAKSCSLLEETVRILYGRGIDTAEKINNFIHPSKDHFISPFKMSGMKECVEMLRLARDEEWQVVVYGDYDADGINAATIMANGLRDFGIEPYVFVPERKNGYGLTIANIDLIFDECCPQLFITVDCGISNANEVEYIKDQGAEVIVTDHHELPLQIPDCICINPKFDDEYPYDNLCGAGVAFKVACALNGKSAYQYLDFAAIATVADSVPLLGENRDIVYEGLKLINENPRKCYSAFLSKSNDDVSAQTIAFSIAPKINAAGRMGDANLALSLFNSNDENEIKEMSVQLTAYNLERQKCCDELYNSAKEKLQQKGALHRVIMLWDENWNTGFVGIVAARLAEEYGRPALLFVKNGDMLKGSARSIENINIYEALKASGKLISEFGGHSQAAGVNITQENFDLLEESLNDYLNSNYTQDDFIPTLYVSNVANLSTTNRLAHELELLEPYGVGHKRPLFMLEQRGMDPRCLKAGSPHVSIKTNRLEFIYFNGTRYMRVLESDIPKNIVFEYNISRYRGKEYLRGHIKEVVYKANDISYANETIGVNQILSLVQEEVPCKKIYKTAQEIDDMMAQEKEYYGTVYIASDCDVLQNYGNVHKFGCELFNLSSRNLANIVLVSPQAEVNLDGYEKIIFLDDPIQISLECLQGKQVYVCSDVLANFKIHEFDHSREALLKIFSYISANSGSLIGSSIEEVVYSNDFEFSKIQVVFALTVFEQLSLIGFKNDALVVYRGVKTDLNNSSLYRLVTSFRGDV